jgi:predicted alpha/beta hydrolase family esterase
VKAALLVAPCDPGLTEEMHPDAITFGRLTEGKLPFPNLLVGSLNDHYMPIDRLVSLGREWNASIFNLGMAGHINISSGFGRWAGGYSLLDGLAGKAKAQKRKGGDQFDNQHEGYPC